MQNRWLDYLIDSSYLGVNRLFVLSFENMTNREVKKYIYSSPNIEMKDYNVIIDRQSFFWLINETWSNNIL